MRLLFFLAGCFSGGLALGWAIGTVAAWGYEYRMAGA